MRKKFALLVAAAAALAALIIVQPGAKPMETGSWGLSFQQEGQPPVGPATNKQLAQYDAAYVGKPEKTLYLTFDAGYENGNTARILDTLKAHDARATFFIVGNFVRDNPELVKRMADEGHLVGNHTLHHYDMSRISTVDTFRPELEGVEALYKTATGREMEKYYRPPQGIYSEENLKMAQELGYKTVFWSLAYVDWKKDAQPTREEAFGKLIPRTHDGAVVLLHSTSRTNAEILDELLSKWESMGYRFAAVDELI